MFSSVFSVLNFELWVQYWSETEEGRGGGSDRAKIHNMHRGLILFVIELDFSVILLLQCCHIKKKKQLNVIGKNALNSNL